MSDFDQDELLLSDAFEEFTTGSTPKINAAGTAAVRKRVARRRRVRVITIVVLTALAVTVSVAVYESRDRGTTRTADPTPTPLDPSARVTLPAGSGLTRELLLKATLTVSAWQGGGDLCATGPVVVADTPAIEIRAVVDADLDDDPALEAAVLIACPARSGGALRSGGGPTQVIAVERDGTRIVTLGWITRGADLREITRRTLAGGGVSVRSGTAEWRGYAWNGTAYVQVDGPGAAG